MYDSDKEAIRNMQLRLNERRDDQIVSNMKDMIDNICGRVDRQDQIIAKMKEHIDVLNSRLNKQGSWILEVEKKIEFIGEEKDEDEQEEKFQSDVIERQIGNMKESLRVLENFLKD